MGLNELVLKVPASEARPPASAASQPSNQASSNRASALKTGSKSAMKTHSRESSGASNVSVKFSVNDETVTTTTCKVPHSHSRSSEEDMTMSDRLSQDLEEDMDDTLHPEQRSKSCESIPHDRLTPYLRNGDIRSEWYLLYMIFWAHFWIFFLFRFARQSYALKDHDEVTRL